MWRKLGWAGLLVAAGLAALVLMPIPIVSLKVEFRKTVAPPAQCNPVKLSISAVDGRTALRLEGTPVEPTKLEAEIARMSNGCPPASSPIDIAADSTIKFREFTELTNRLKSAGYTKLYLIRIDRP
jgi:biopolymer transport protein ExbD